MGTSTFSGPIKAGPIKFTTGTTLGQDVANVGNVVLAQSEAVTQATNGGSAGVYTSNIVIPAGSIITDIELYVTAIWSGVASTLDLDQHWYGHGLLGCQLRSAGRYQPLIGGPDG